jgi:thiol-disulfide isomerase/thioredoxin
MIPMRGWLRSIVAASVLLAGTASAGVLLQPEPAPDWQVSGWINGNPGKLSNQHGKVVLLHFFQLWCPVCNAFSVPLFLRWEEKYGARGDVVILSIHSVFEGHDVQTPQRLQEFVESRGIHHPVGIDAYASPDKPSPITMDLYKTGGTPHVVIIDREGQQRFSHFGWFDPSPVEAFIDRLLLEGADRRAGSAAAAKPAPPTPQQQQQPAPPTPAAPAGGENPALSGKYRLNFEQSARSCGQTVQLPGAMADVKVYSDHIAVSFSRPFLGVRQLKADFDPATGRFTAEISERVTERGDVGIRLDMELSGRLFEADGKPTVEYEFSVDKRGDDSAWDCLVSGHGKGSRVR